MQYGLTRRYSRDRVPMQVLRGFDPTTPGKLSSLAAPIDDEAIRSGMVMVKATGLVNGVSTAGAFRRATALDAVGADGTNESVSFYLALADQDAHDVQAAGGIVGLDCSDDFEVQTGYFDKEVDAYAVGDPLTVGGEDETAGMVTLADEDDWIIGYVTRIGAGTSASIDYTGKTLPTASVVNAEVIQFKTAKTGQRKIVAL